MFEPFIPFVLPSNVDAVFIAKTNLRGILDSYHGDWDFLIELVQNAVDALDLKFSDTTSQNIEKPEVEITINQNAGSIRVSDNGIGMDAEMAKLVLCPNYTNKPYSKSQAGKRSLRGHKGVGLTFLAFGFNLLRYCSKKENQFFSAEISGGRHWLDSENSSEPPKVNPSGYCPEFLEGRLSGTSVEVVVGNDFFQRVNLNWLGWHYIIRCLTAAGYCDINGLLPWNKDAVVSLKVIDSGGMLMTPPDGYSDQLPLEYFYPDAVLKSCDLDAYFVKYAERTEPPTSEKGKYEALHIRWDTDKIESVLFDKGDIDDKRVADTRNTCLQNNIFPQSTQCSLIRNVFGRSGWTPGILTISDEGFGDQAYRL